MTDTMKELADRSAAARAGMGIESSETDQDTVEETEEEEREVTPEPEEEVSPKSDDRLDTNEEEAEDEEEEETEHEPEEKPQPRTPSVFKQLNEFRTQKRESDRNVKRLLELVGADSIEEAESRINKLRESAPLSDEFMEAAREIGVEDPTALKKLVSLMAGEVKKDIEPRLAPIQERVDTLGKSQESVEFQQQLQESMAVASEEWNELLPMVETMYKMTPSQAEEAKKLMLTLAHSDKYNDKELDYILYKEADQFEAILGAPKKKSMVAKQGAKPTPISNHEDRGGMIKPDGTHEGYLRARARNKEIASSEMQGNTDYI